MNISWIKPEELIEHEFKQLAEEGKSYPEYEKEWNKVKAETQDAAERRKASKVMLAELAVINLERYKADKNEPSDIENIFKCLTSNNIPVKTDIPRELIYDKIHGGWIGRASGCLLGKPVEKMKREVIKEILQAGSQWPLTNYITENGIPGELLEKYTWNRHSGRESLRENIVCMTEDDDLNYTMVNLFVAEKYGRDFTTGNIIETWLDMLPVLETFTAERIAYINSLALMEPPDTAVYSNPYREWIGAQIRADMWGWINPGDPLSAAKLAFKDARLSHVKNGIYGEMYVAAMIAASFAWDDPLKIINAGLSVIPPKSRTAEAIRFAIEINPARNDWENTLDKLYEKFGRYHWVHTINNAALVTAVLLYGNNDFEKSVCATVMGSWDTDSNGATIGAILGTVLGSKNLPEKWIAPLNNKIRSSLRGFDNSSFDLLAERTFALIK